ncbi:hypothetical protein C8R45DRAFT_948494 [Mycena sanguinolenta]|nr:hypothetical protein C8R45DRAFT_948494 [Mycena sanguinolenta]
MPDSIHSLSEASSGNGGRNGAERHFGSMGRLSNLGNYDARAIKFVYFIASPSPPSTLAASPPPAQSSFYPFATGHSGFYGASTSSYYSPWGAPVQSAQSSDSAVELLDFEWGNKFKHGVSHSTAELANGHRVSFPFKFCGGWFIGRGRGTRISAHAAIKHAFSHPFAFRASRRQMAPSMPTPNSQVTQRRPAPSSSCNSLSLPHLLPDVLLSSPAATTATTTTGHPLPTRPSRPRFKLAYERLLPIPSLWLQIATTTTIISAARATASASTPARTNTSRAPAADLTAIRPLLQANAFTGTAAVATRLFDYCSADVDAATRMEILTKIRDGAGNHYFRTWVENPTAVDITHEWVKAAFSASREDGDDAQLGETIMPLLHLIDWLPMTVESLKMSKLGKVVVKFVKDPPTPAIKDIASNVERRWRQMVTNKVPESAADDPKSKKRKIADPPARALPPLKKTAVVTARRCSSHLVNLFVDVLIWYYDGWFCRVWEAFRLRFRATAGEAPNIGCLGTVIRTLLNDNHNAAVPAICPYNVSDGERTLSGVASDDIHELTPNSRYVWITIRDLFI